VIGLRKNLKSFTLLEVLIAAAIAAFMIALVLGIWRRQLHQSAFLQDRSEKLAELERFVKDFVGAFWMTQPPVVIDKKLFLANSGEAKGGWAGATLIVTTAEIRLLGGRVFGDKELKAEDVKVVFKQPTCEIDFYVNGKLKRKVRYKNWNILFERHGKFLKVNLYSKDMRVEFDYRIPMWFN